MTYLFIFPYIVFKTYEFQRMNFYCMNTVIKSNKLKNISVKYLLYNQNFIEEHVEYSNSSLS